LNNIPILILVFGAGRLVINMTRRFAYPFIPAIAQRLAAPVSSVQTALAISWGVGVLSPLFGGLSERYGRKRVMLGALALLTLASLVGALLLHIWVFAFVVIAYGVSKMIFDPALQAYIGDQVPFGQRARVWGAIELSWSLSLFVAAPLTGFLLSEASLQAVFLALGALMLLSLGLIWRFIPADEPRSTTQRTVVLPPFARLFREKPQVLAALGYTLCLIAGQEIFFINYALWMEASFDLVLAALGLVTVVIGIAEAVGELVVSGLGDRVGTQRLALWGSLFTAIGFLVLPLTSHSLPLALVGMFGLFVLIEVAIVASITLFTELLPEARSVMMSANIGAASLGRLFGALVGGSLYALTGNFVLIGAVTMGIVLAGSGLMWRVVRAHQQQAG
jgi:MFS transporter, DHA1 family, inner membrane transport protein